MEPLHASGPIALVTRARRAERAAISAVALVFMLIAMPAFATPLTEGSVLPNYAVVSVGPGSSQTSGTSVFINSGPINGKVLVGDGSFAGSSGGNNGGQGMSVTQSGSVNGSASATNAFDMLNNPIPSSSVNVVASSVGTQAYSDAHSLALYAAGLSPTSGTTVTTIGSTITITGNGGLNVIDFTSLNNPHITIVGTSADTFVINVSGQLQTNQAMVLSGVSASQILWNFTGSGTVFQTSGGDAVDGTFLAAMDSSLSGCTTTVNCQAYQFSNLNLDGQLIDTDGHMQIVSGSGVQTFAPFTPPGSGGGQGVPEPATFTLLASGLIAFGVMQRRRRKSY